MPVSTLVTVTWTFGTTAPDGSYTTPTTRPVASWANTAWPAKLNNTSAMTKNRETIQFIMLFAFISPPPGQVFVVRFFLEISVVIILNFHRLMRRAGVGPSAARAETALVADGGC